MYTITLYTIVSSNDIETLKATNYLPFQGEGDEEDFMDEWMMSQMTKRLPSIQDVPTPQINVGPFWCFYNEDDCYPLLFDDQIVVEFKTQLNSVLFFDDNDWIQVANNVNNNEIVTYLAHSEEEAQKNISANQESILASWEKMFNVGLQERDETYCGPIQLRAVVPYISKSMITNMSL